MLKQSTTKRPSRNRWIIRGGALLVSVLGCLLGVGCDAQKPSRWSPVSWSPWWWVRGMSVYNNEDAGIEGGATGTVFEP